MQLARLMQLCSNSLSSIFPLYTTQPVFPVFWYIMDFDNIIKPTLDLARQSTIIDKVRISEKLSLDMEKLIKESQDPVDTLDQFLCQMHGHSMGRPEHFDSPEGTAVMSMESILMRAVWYLWHRCPDMHIKHLRQSLGMIPMAIRRDNGDSVMHSERGVPHWWPDYQRVLFRDIHYCLNECKRKDIDATFGYRMIYLACYATDRISPMNIGNYCPEEAKLLEILTIAIGKLRQKGQKDDQYLSNVIRRALQEQRPINYTQIIANAAWFLNGMARLLIKEKVYIALRDLSDNKPLGLHNKKFTMLSLCKLLPEYMPYAPTMKDILRKILDLIPRVELAYQLMKTQNYVEENYDCLPTCLELAFPTQLDDPQHVNYVCEFTYFRDILRYIEYKHDKLYRELLQSLDEEQTNKLNYYQSTFNPRRIYRIIENISDSCKFQCLNHRFLPDESRCPLVDKQYVILRRKETHDA